MSDTWFDRQPKKILKLLHSSTIFYPEFDGDIMGVACPNKTGEITRHVIAYNMNAVIARLQKENKLSEVDALEHAQINIIGGWLGDNTPLHVWLFSVSEARNLLNLKKMPKHFVGFGHRAGCNTVVVYENETGSKPVKVHDDFCHPVVLIRTDRPTHDETIKDP